MSGENNRELELFFYKIKDFLKLTIFD